MKILDRSCVRERAQLAVGLIATWALIHAHRGSVGWLAQTTGSTAVRVAVVAMSRTLLWTFFSALLVCFVQRYASQALSRGRRMTMFAVAVPLVAVAEAIVETALLRYRYAIIRQPFWTWVQQLTLTPNIVIAALAVLIAHFAFARQQAAQRRQLQLELEAELTSMQADQIRDRFHAPGLHAMIEGIHDTAATNREKASQRLNELAQLLRLGMELDGQPEVRLQDELDFADRYAALRRPEIPLRIEADVSALEVLVPPRVVPSFVDGLVSTAGSAIDLRISIENDLHVSAATVAPDGRPVVSNLRLPLGQPLLQPTAAIHRAQ